MKEKGSFKQAMVWLGVAVVLSFLADGDTPVELAVWLSPVFLLRFFRMTKPLKGFLIAFPCMTLSWGLSSWGMSPPMPIPVIIVLTLIASAAGLLPYLLDRILAAKLPGGLRPLLLPAFVVTIDFLIFLSLGAGTWGSEAYGIRDMVWLQLVSVTGIWGITFLIYWTAGMINEIWLRQKSIIELRGQLISFVIVLTVIYGYGVLRLQVSKPIEHSVRVAGITPNPTHRETLNNDFRLIISNITSAEAQIPQIRANMDRMFQDLMKQSITMANSGVEMVVWSEGAAVIFAGDEERYIRQACLAAKEHGIYLGLAVGVLMDNMVDLYKDSQPFIKNKLIFILPDGNIAWEHMKATLVPGPEAIITIPGDGILKTVNVPVVPIGSVTGAICYEMDFPQLIRQAGRSGSSLLLAPANDWPAIKHMHAMMARTRAIENGLAVIRPTSGGISIAVDPYGRMVSQVDYYQSRGGALDALLPVKPVSTLYSSLGDFFAWMVLIGTLFLLIAGMIRSKRQKK